MKEKLQRYPKVPRMGGCHLHTALCWGLLRFPQPTGQLAMVSCSSAQACRAAVC